MTIDKFLFDHWAETVAAILLMIEGKSDEEISENFNGKILLSILENHGNDSVVNISTIRITDTIRLFHNYLSFINMKHGKIEPKWPVESIFV